MKCPVAKSRYLFFESIGIGYLNEGCKLLPPMEAFLYSSP